MSMGEKSLRIIEFSGKKDDWKVWSQKWLARASMKGYKNVVIGKQKIPKKTEYEDALQKDTQNASDKSQIKNYELNTAGFEDLILSICGTTSTGKVAFELVAGCETQANPDGDVALAWKRRIQKYEPKTAPSYIKLKRKFVNSKLKSAENDPEEWITELEGLKTEMNNVLIPGKTEMSEVDLVIHILSSLPEEYEVAVSALEDKMMNASSAIDIEDVREKVVLRYDRLKQQEKVNLEAREEKAFAAFKREWDYKRE